MAQSERDRQAAELDPQLRERLDEVARQKGRDVRELLDEAVREYLQRAGGDGVLGTDAPVPPPKGG